MNGPAEDEVTQSGVNENNVNNAVNRMSDSNNFAMAMAAPSSFSVAERALLQRLMVEQSLPSTSVQEGTQQMEHLLSNNTISYQVGGNLMTENDVNFGNSMHNTFQTAAASMASQPAASASLMPQHQNRYSNNGLDLALSQYGYGYPSLFEPSMVSTYNQSQFDPTVPTTFSQQAPAPAATPSTLPLGNNFAPLEQSQNYFPGTTSMDDWMSMQRSSSLRSFGARATTATASVTTFESNSTSEVTAPSAPANSPPSQLANAFSRRHQSVSASASTQDLSSNVQNPPTSLVIQSDVTFLDPIHIFLRSTCIELFTTTQEHMLSSGRGARAFKIGQVGLRCAFCRDVRQQELTRQATCYPSKRETIFESIRNYQRVHLNDCPCIPQQTKAKYKSLLESDMDANKRSQRFVKAYYTEAASEIGLVDTPKGLAFGALPNTSNLRALTKAAEMPTTSSNFWKNYNSSSSKDKPVELRKFEHLASEQTRQVIRNARSESSPFVYPHDFPTVSDSEFLLYKQVLPCKPSASTLKRRGIDPMKFKTLAGICCKHCARVHEGESQNDGMYFPMNKSAFVDSSFTQSLLNHVMGCKNVPQELRDAFDELKRLASEHCAVTKRKRGSKRKFLEKIWYRMENYYA